MTQDLNKNICSIEYNLLNLPTKISFTDGSTVKYCYSADGEKLSADYNLTLMNVMNGTSNSTQAGGGVKLHRDYCGDFIYEDGALKCVIYILFIFCCFACNKKALDNETTKNGFSPKLQMALDSFIQKYPSPVYYVLSETFDTCTVVTFGTSSAYSVNLVDCYIKDKKHLITYYSVDSIYDKSLINKDKMTAFNENQIKGFRGDTVLTNCHSYVERYCVSKDSMRKMAKNENFVKFPQKAKASDVFARKEMNFKLNSFINRHDSYVTEIRFFQYQHERYVAFYPNIFYDISLIDAYFFRNGHFVAIYGLKEAPQDWIRKTAISCYKGSIPKIRCSKKTIWYLPFPDIFMFKDGKMIRVDDFKSFLLIGECFG